MSVLSDFSSSLVEFKHILPKSSHCELVNKSTATDQVNSNDKSAETTTKGNVSTQFPFLILESSLKNDEYKLMKWLHGILPIVDHEFEKGPTVTSNDWNDEDKQLMIKSLKAQKYQKILMGGIDNSQGLATWLTVHTDNAPVLVATTVAPHDDWCDHVNQSLNVFVPKRSGNFMVYTEMHRVPLKSCLKILCTNPFDKSIFAGASVVGDIYVWKYEYTSGDNVDIKQLFFVTSAQSDALAIEWPTLQCLLVCYSNGLLQQWLLANDMQKEWEYYLNQFINPSTEITSLLSLSLNHFIFGSRDGRVYRCWIAGVKKEFNFFLLCRHPFLISSLLKANFKSNSLLLSCDLSGTVFYYHDTRNSAEEILPNVFKIPLPFKNLLACSRKGNIIYCPSKAGTLECFCIDDGIFHIIKGVLCGKGNFIKISDNSCWIITGLYQNEFQIFCLKN